MTYKNDCVLESQGGNGNKLKQLLHVNMKAEILDRALQHSSYQHEKRFSPEQLEKEKAKSLLGHSLLKLLCIAHFLRHSQMTIQEINKLENTEQLANDICSYYKINDLFYLGKGDQKERKTFYMDILTKVIYEIYRHCGYEETYRIVKPVLLSLNPINNVDYKSRLQEYAQNKKINLSYKLIKEEGDFHDRTFTVEVKCGNKYATAIGKSKKKAEKLAAERFIKEQNIMIKSKEGKEESLVRLGKLKHVTPIRVKEVNNLRNSFGLSNKDISDFLLDTCLIHKSYRNEVGNKNLDTNEILSFFGSYVLTLYVDEYLFENFTTFCQDSSKNLAKRRAAIINNEFLYSNLHDFNKDRWLPCIKGVKGLVNDTTEKSIAPAIFQSLIGSLFIHSYIYKKNSIEDVRNKIFSMISKFSSGQESGRLYSHWIQEFCTRLGMEYVYSDKEKGMAHERMFSGELTLFYSNSSLPKQVFTTSATNKKRLREELARIMFVSCEDNFNLNRMQLKIPNKESWNLLLREIIDAAIQSHKKNDNFSIVLGGMCFTQWSLQNAISILGHLYERMLYQEITKIYSLWKQTHAEINTKEAIQKSKYVKELSFLLYGGDNDSDEVKNVPSTNKNAIELRNSRNKKQEPMDSIEKPIIQTKKMVSEEVKKEEMTPDIKSSNPLRQKVVKRGGDSINVPIQIVETKRKSNVSKENKTNTKSNESRQLISVDVPGYISKQQKKVIIFTKIYEFQTKNCPFCENTLNETDNYIQVVYKKNRIIIEHSVLSCSICSIKGASGKVLKELEKHNFSIEMYGGSPSYYASTIIEKRSVVTYVIEQNKQKKKTRSNTITPEELEKQLEIKKKIGFEGESHVFLEEKEHLRNIGRMDLAEKVTWVANENCNAGYDIQSFFEDGSYKYIEVKSTTARNVNFYLTNNELEVAKMLGDNYFIYRVSNLRSIPQINKIQNPYDLISQNKLELKPTQYMVTVK
ncbi:putative dsRNA-binding protein [Bacillus cereus]|uniref:putative dsRNA-binding protein n=1 Tax=Bacillus cereus TaxID=1396 RepID=UPI00307AAB6A